MNSKERAALRSQANTLEPIAWLGKEGISENFLEQIKGVFRSRELIKISVQENSPEDAKTLAPVVAQATDSEVVQVMGRKITLYKFNPELHEVKKAKPLRVKREKEDSKSNPNKFYRSGRAKGYGSAKSRWKDKGVK